jgi:hypothetical protein
MDIRFYPIGGSGHGELDLGQVRLMFSYGVLVGVRTNAGKWRSSPSVTTSKHLNNRGYRDAAEVTPEDLQAMAKKALGL